MGAIRLISPVAQLKVNLRPLWTPAAQALSEIADRFGDLVWDLVFNELRSISGSSDSDSIPSWQHVQDDEELDSISEQEKTWRDPSAHKLRCQNAFWLRGNAAKRIVIQVRQQD